MLLESQIVWWLELVENAYGPSDSHLCRICYQSEDNVQLLTNLSAQVDAINQLKRIPREKGLDAKRKLKSYHRLTQRSGVHAVSDRPSTNG
jgi:hypothetical protein